MVSTRKRVEYALGYVTLGLLDEASDELEAVAFDDRFTAEVVAARVELHMAAKHWDIVVGYASRLTELDAENPQGWICWAYALRERGRVAEARSVLLQVEKTHGSKQAVIPYNLACYNCLLGDFGEAKHYLVKAGRMDANFKVSALEDCDLKAMWKQIASMW